MKRIEELVSPSAIRGNSWREKQKFGFVDLVSNEDAERIVARLNGADIEGSKIVVEFSRGSRAPPQPAPVRRNGSGRSAAAPVYPSPAPATVSDFSATSPVEGSLLASSPVTPTAFAAYALPLPPPPAASAGEEKTNSLVLKNLPFNLAQATLWNG